MFTVMLMTWVRDVFGCPCQVLLEECGISPNPRISTSGELYDVVKSTLQNYHPHWPPLGPGNQAFSIPLTPVFCKKGACVGQ